MFLVLGSSSFEGSLSEGFELRSLIITNYHVRPVAKLDVGGHLHLLCYMHYHTL